MNEYLSKIKLDNDVMDILTSSKELIFPKTREELLALAFGKTYTDEYNVEYEIPGIGKRVEATVTRCKNGVVINYPDDYMRRRDPDSLIVADDQPTDKPKFKDSYGYEFNGLRKETFAWLKDQDLIVLPFLSGGAKYGYPSILIAPANAGHFALALADLQGHINIDDIEGTFEPVAIVFLAPPFRHTHFEGKQICVHNRLEKVHEVFSYNLYPGPSAKKGVYSVLLNIGEREDWTTCHASAVKVITPYDNEIVIMHEGASGGGKSEMLEKVHREADDRVLLAKNTVTGEKNYLRISETCELRPVTDDMALCHPKMQNESNKLVVGDAETGWFLRVDNITAYGENPSYERLFMQPSQPLVFINLQGSPNSTCIPWEHTLDSNGQPCPNPRVILPRTMVPNIVDGTVEVDVRSFGVRCPACTKADPTYGIIGMMHVLPPALAWIWRLVAPRGFKNPSIVDNSGNAMKSEGVGSYWPFATGKMVKQANLLLEQICSSTSTRYIIIPNQHIGAYDVGFMPEWISREYIARRGGAKFKPEHLVEARCTLLGYCLESIKVDGQYIRKAFLQPEMQGEIGIEAYDKGAKIIMDFFKEELVKFNTPELEPLGRQIIDSFLNNASLQDYMELIPMRF